jgi:peptidyl-prolyl cis-trans isomerase SurA
MHTDLHIDPPAAPRRRFSAVPRHLLLAALCLLPWGQAALAAEPIDRIVAVVNDEVITESELNLRLEEVSRRIAQQKIQAPPANILKKQVLERTILEHLQLQVAQLTGIVAGDDKVDTALRNISEQNHMSLAELYKTVAQDGMSQTSFREQIRNQIVIQQLMEREIGNRITVSDSEVANFLANSENLDGGTEYELSHILIALPETATPEVIQQTREHAEKVLQTLRQGGAFDQAAIANSQGDNALEGGKLGWKKTGQLPTLFVNALKTMQPGDVSDLLRSPSGLHILKLHAKRGGKKSLTITQVHARHILLRTNAVVTPQEAWQRLDKLRLRIQNGDDFGELARSNSEDPGSASNGGDLGWVNPGQTVPEFEKAMNALKPDEISAPVQTPFGLHLIQVLERRERDISNERDLADARQQIHGRKADERYAQWVRQLRDEAYIEYRIDLE